MSPSGVWGRREKCVGGFYFARVAPHFSVCLGHVPRFHGEVARARLALCGASAGGFFFARPGLKSCICRHVMTKTNPYPEGPEAGKSFHAVAAMAAAARRRRRRQRRRWRRDGDGDGGGGDGDGGGVGDGDGDSDGDGDGDTHTVLGRKGHTRGYLSNHVSVGMSWPRRAHALRGSKLESCSTRRAVSPEGLEVGYPSSMLPPPSLPPPSPPPSPSPSPVLSPSPSLPLPPSPLLPPLPPPLPSPPPPPSPPSMWKTHEILKSVRNPGEILL